MNFSYSFPTLKHYNDINFIETVLWILNATKKPPHLGISTQKRFFSLKMNGKDENVSYNEILKIIHTKKIPTILIKINLKLSLKELENEYMLYSNIIQGKNTCLSPIKNVLKTPQANQLSELLYLLSDSINLTAGMYLPDNYNQLPSYSITEINMRIEHLSNKKQKVNE